MSGKKGHNHSVDTRSFHRSSWNCSHRCLFNKHHGAGILKRIKRNRGEPQQQKPSQVKPQLEPTSRSSGRCEFSRFLAAKHEAGTLVRTSVCETSLTWISLQKIVYTSKAIRMNHQHLLSKQIHLKKSMGGDWQRPRLMLYSYLICVCVHSELSTPEHNIVKSKLCFLCLKIKNSLRT